MERYGNEPRSARSAMVAGALVLVLAGMAALSAQARGPDREGRGPSADRIATRMAERVGLTADQKTRVQEILAQDIATRTAIREEGRKKLASLREETDKHLAGVLSQEQMDKLRFLREERRDHRRDRRRDCAARPEGRDGGFPDGPRPERD